ncbi:uncharacterized protein LOC141631334 [Silene latifolia]|uniref:uncharacterized protein LOC141631334 n=1 Tax=Silene latifolia TaxID=37657 RepID=UPI003D780319
MEMKSKPPSSHSRDAKDLEIVTSYHITAEEIPDDSEEVEADKAPETLEDEVQSTVDDLKELNLGTDEDPRPIYVSALLTKEEEEEYYKLLVEYKDVFAWSYKEMPGLSPKIAVHRLAIRKGISPRKYPTWIANIVPVRKKNGQLRVCVDFRDLNDACPKDDFPLPVTKLMIDATTGHEALSFMDCTAGYNQIHMAPEDQEATGKPLVLYISAQERSLGAMCAQEIEDRKERALYYLIRTLVGAELNYSAIEKICLALVFDIQKLRHYMQAYTIHVISKVDPIKYILSRPVLSGRLAKWAVLLKQYDLVFVSQKAVKGQVIADFFADHPVPTDWELSDELPGEEIFTWTFYLHGKFCNRWAVSLLKRVEDIDTTNMICVYTTDEDDWRKPIIDFLDHQKLPDDPRHKVEVRRRAPKFLHDKGTLYIRSFLGHWLRCLNKDEATEAMHEAHSSICGAHQSGPKLYDRVKRMGYY